MSKLYIVGIGPGSADYLTPAAIKAIKESNIIIGSRRALNLFQKDGKKRELNAKNIKDGLNKSISMVKEGKIVSILSTGDPGFSGVLKPILDLNTDIEIEVIPGVSSIQLCAAKLKIPWDNANLVTMHGKGVPKNILDLINNGKPSIIFPDFKPAELASYLIREGIDGKRKAVVCEKLSYKGEKIVEASIKDISLMDFSYMSIMVIY